MYGICSYSFPCRTVALVAANDQVYNIHMAPNEKMCIPMSQTWIRVGLDGEPYTSTQPGTLGSHHHSRISGRFDCPAALRAISGAALSPTVSSSSPKSTQVPPVMG